MRLIGTGIRNTTASNARKTPDVISTRTRFMSGSLPLFVDAFAHVLQQDAVIEKIDADVRRFPATFQLVWLQEGVEKPIRYRTLQPNDTDS
jgi:hypothetical protein